MIRFSAFHQLSKWPPPGDYYFFFDYFFFLNPLETWYRYIGFQGLRVYCHCPFSCAIQTLDIAAILILSFFKVLLKFKVAAMDELHNFLWSQKRKIEVINNSQSPSGNVQEILLKFKMATTSELCDRKNC